ncbi:MAG: amidohydrolase family protein [Acidobacteria bacterium]|nr:amidohydrolase family protein [Acidobacteriota bacterium]
MTRYLAEWVLPMTGPPIRRGRVDVVQGMVVSVGSRATDDVAASTLDLGGAVILPALVNAHTHLELSGLRDGVPPAESMPAWVDRLLAQRGASGPPVGADILRAVRESRASGTGLVGDISNTLASVPALEQAAASACVFREVLGFTDDGSQALVDAAEAELAACGSLTSVRLGLAAHAPYSVGPALFRALDRAIRRRPGVPRCVHLGESPEELQFLSVGAGPWRDLLERIGRWNPSWVPPGCGPVEYLDRMGWLGPDLVAVHGVQLTDSELACLADRSVTVVTCPRSNRWTGVGDPPIDRFFKSGVRLAVGTDSLASAPDLNVFAELAAMRRCAPSVPAGRLLRCATSAGADALGFGETHGRIAPGRRAAVVTVSLPAGVSDVEEYLVSGITPDQVDWLQGPDLPTPGAPSLPA